MRMDDAQSSQIHRSRLDHPSKAEKTLSIVYSAACLNHAHYQKYYNFLKINATSQKAHDLRKKA